MSGAVPARLGKYEIRGTLGKGAMGTVYDGWDPVIDRRVAIKTVRLPAADDEEATEALARFKREAQAAGRLTHPNIVGVFDYGETDELAYIVMEFVEGRSLKEVLAANERMAVSGVVSLMTDVLAGLTYSHGRGVVHRDIKPANIMLAGGTQAKIADFGIARIEASSMTQAGTVMGTPAYMSPEQFMGQVVDSRTDIYSCGVMLYQMLTGDRPFEGSMTAIMHKAMTTVPPRPSELAVTAPANLDGVVAKAMARRPDDRFATAAEFAAALRAPPAIATSDETVMELPPRAPPPASTAAATLAAAPPAGKPSRLPIIAGSGLALLAVAGTAAWFLLTPRAAEPPAPQTQAVQTPAPQAPAPQAPAPQAPASQTATTQAPPTQAPTTQAPTTQAPTTQTSTTRPPTTQPAPAITPEPPAQLAMQSPPSQPPSPARPVAPATPPVSQPPPQAATPPVPVETPAPPPPSTPAAITIPPASRSASAIEASLGALGSARCSLARSAVARDGAVTVTGLAGSGQPTEALRRVVDAAGPVSVAWQVTAFDGPFCPVLDLVRSYADPSGRGGTAGLELGQIPPGGILRDNQVIGLRAVMPDFGGYLQVLYVQHDATVAPLVPGPGYPSQTYPARAALELGTPKPGFAGWHVGPPFGEDMVLSLASTAPLFTTALPESQPLPSFLASLQAAADALRRRGGKVSASVILLDTRP